MEWYMGKYIRPLSDAVFTIASDDLWIESLAIQQLHTTANLPNMQRVVGMPDLHPGRGYPIGAAFFSVGRFYPTRRRRVRIGLIMGAKTGFWALGVLPLMRRNNRMQSVMRRCVRRGRAVNMSIKPTRRYAPRIWHPVLA